jgi:hypothetical protein
LCCIFSQPSSCRQRRLDLERKLTRTIRELHKEQNAARAKRSQLILWPRPATTEWVRRVQPNGQRRWMSKNTARLMMRAQLIWGFENYVRSAMLTFGTPLLSYHDAWTTHTCLWCAQFRKHAIPQHRYRRCPNEKCEAHRFEVHRDLIGCLNGVAVATAQALAWLHRRFAWDPG